MSIATLEPTRHRVAGDIAAALADLQAAHLEFAACAADLALTPAAAWAELDRIIAAACTEAYDLTAVLTGRRSTSPARQVPPVVRLRELTAAQRSLNRVLDSRQRVGTPADAELAAADRSAGQVRMLGGLLRRQVVDSGAEGP